MKKLTLAFCLLLTSHMHAWQPSGWVYQMGDYQYEYESGDWYWKMDWDFWHVKPSTQDWTKNPADGWSYYTYPYFYSTSMGQWRFASFQESAADVVNLSTRGWSKFGQEAQTAFAPRTIEEGTVMAINNPIDGNSVAFLGNNGNYYHFSTDLSWVDIGVYAYTKEGANSATLTTNYSGLTYPNRTMLMPYPVKIDDINFSSDYSFTSVNREDEGNPDSVVSDVSIEDPQEYAPSSLVGIISTSINYEYSSTWTFSSATSATSSNPYNRQSLTYSYEKSGPREGSIEAFFLNAEGGVVDVNVKLFFMAEKSGYYITTSKDTSYPISYRWGSFSVSNQ